MKTKILCRGKWEAVSDHSKPIPLKPDRSVDYMEYVNRIEQVYTERTERLLKRALTEVF